MSCEIKFCFDFLQYLFLENASHPSMLRMDATSWLEKKRQCNGHAEEIAALHKWKIDKHTACDAQGHASEVRAYPGT